MSVLERIEAALDTAPGRPQRLVLGHAQARALEAELYQPARVWRGLFGEPLFSDPERRPELPYPLVGAALLYDVPIERVDEADCLRVVTDG